MRHYCSNPCESAWLRMQKTSLPQPDADELAHSAKLESLIREEIKASGPMPFSRFMERCLYAPGLGYYSAGRHKFGAAGDFITAPELGDIFGRCLAHAFVPTLRELGETADLVELGGGSGALAETVLLALAAAGHLPRRFRMLEPSADLKQRQRQRLQAALPAEIMARVEWLDGPPDESWQGILFANEVIDALPATRFTLHDGEVMEEHVQVDSDGQLQSADRPADALISGAIRHLERDQGAKFTDGYRSEALPQLPYWMQAIAGTMTRGALWFIDYGYTRREFYHEERRDGTLIAHYRHHAHDDALRWPGLQDLSTSVDFTAVAEACNQAGFMVASYLSQAQFLIASNLEQVYSELIIACRDEADTYTLSQQVKRLTLPGQMGERFKVMALARDLPPEALPADVLAASQGQRL